MNGDLHPQPRRPARRPTAPPSDGPTGDGHGAGLTFQVDGGLLSFDAQAVVVAGFTGRDRADVRRHVEELAAEGVAPPPTVPAFYVLPPSALTRAGVLWAVRPRTSGEAEIALLVDGDDMYVTLASDHTDRGVEAVDIALSKEVCPKPIARVAWPYADVADRWDSLRLRSWVLEAGERRLYQDGYAKALLPPGELLRRMPLPPDVRRFVVLTGTVPALGGIRPGDGFWAELGDGEGERTIELDYAVRCLERVEVEA
ncbi:MAG: DUF2848 family protein [Thermoleophilaceae bacterium]